jgi:Aspartyl protease
MSLGMKRTARQLTELTLLSAAMLFLAGCFSMSAVPPPAGLAQAERPNGHDSAHLDTAAKSEIESDWGSDGAFILLHPKVNGHDVGWFILDSGASGCTITADAATRAGLPAIGSTRLQGETRTTVFRCESLGVGPLTLTGLHMTGLNMSRSSQAFGRPVAGILGRNVFASAVVELDGPGRAVRLHDAQVENNRSELLSVPVEMRRGLPNIRCAYADIGEGLFVVDTGADATVHFLGLAVERYGLTKAAGVTITGAKSQITFGSMRRIDEGSVDDFRIGGRQFGPRVATFARPGDAPSKLLPDVDGLVGMGLMREFRLFVDEPHGCIRFAARPTVGSAG